MTPKEKAKQLVEKYLNASFNCTDCDIPYCDIQCTKLSINEAKQCALIAVDEILNLDLSVEGRSYWMEVKIEIEKLYYNQSKNRFKTKK